MNKSTYVTNEEYLNSCDSYSVTRCLSRPRCLPSRKTAIHVWVNAAKTKPAEGSCYARLARCGGELSHEEFLHRLRKHPDNEAKHKLADEMIEKMSSVLLDLSTFVKKPS